jgi:hypothetical protein
MRIERHGVPWRNLVVIGVGHSQRRPPRSGRALYAVHESPFLTSADAGRRGSCCRCSLSLQGVTVIIRPRALRRICQKHGILSTV